MKILFVNLRRMKLRKNGKKPMKRRAGARQKTIAKYQMPEDAVLDYKNVSLIQKYLNERGKIVPRRITGISAKNQRKLSLAIKRARFLALLTTGGANQLS